MDINYSLFNYLETFGYLANVYLCQGIRTVSLSTQIRQAGVELGLTQAETVSLELDLIKVGLENIIWSQNI